MKKIGIAATVAVLAAIGIGIFAINAFPGSGSGTPSTQSIATHAIGDTSTVNTTNVVVTTVAHTQLACNNSTGGGERVCLLLSGWSFNYTSRTVALVVGIFGIQNSNNAITAVTAVSPITIANITFSGSPTNKGFTDSVNLYSPSLQPPSEFEQTILSPGLPNLQRGDQIVVTVRGTAGTYFTTTFTT